MLALKNIFLLFCLLLITTVSQSQELAGLPTSSGDDRNRGLPLWELGAGLGYTQFEHYPASNENSWLLLPFPTFQYRGEILRANDSDGARAYLFKDKKWSLDFSGNLHPGQHFADDSARKGMDEIPWVIELGPQLNYEFNEYWEAQFDFFQAVSSDFKNTKQNGQTFQAHLKYKWSVPCSFLNLKAQAMGNITAGIYAGTSDFLGTYFDVPNKFATSTRPAYSSVAGLLSDELTFFQGVKTGATNFYFGFAITNYDISANRQSYLHKSDHNLSYFVGVTFTLDVSKQMAVKEEDTEGLVNKYYDKH